MVAVVTLCFIAAFAAMGGLAVAGLVVLVPAAGLGAGAALMAAPACGLVSLASGIAAAVLVLCRQDRAA
jgi:hypothetical protein